MIKNASSNNQAGVIIDHHVSVAGSYKNLTHGRKAITQEEFVKKIDDYCYKNQKTLQVK